jgi:hypothetical protein
MKSKSLNISGFDVYLDDVLIDTVFYSRDFFKGFSSRKEACLYVKASLINHDGYNDNIEVK